MSSNPFSPAYGKTQEISVTDTSDDITIDKNFHRLYLKNTGDETAYVKVARGTATATTSDFPVLGGESIPISISSDVTSVAAIAKSGLTTTLVVTPGTGG